MSHAGKCRKFWIYETDDKTILKKTLLPASNVFCYGQVESRYGSGQFFKDLIEAFTVEHEKVILSKIENKEGILQSIKDFLGKGK